MNRLIEYLKERLNYLEEVVDYMTTAAPVERSRLEKIWGQTNKLTLKDLN